MHVDKRSNMLFFILVIQTVYGGSKDNKKNFFKNT